MLDGTAAEAAYNKYPVGKFKEVDCAPELLWAPVCSCGADYIISEQTMPTRHVLYCCLCIVFRKKKEKQQYKCEFGTLGGCDCRA